MASSFGLDIFQRIWKPAAATGAGSAAVVFWLEEILFFAEILLIVIFLPLLAVLLYLYNHFLFKTRDPRQDQIKLQGKKK